MSESQPTLQPNQSVLGYVLKERIGVGGYGEVWSAEAPGGMLKAAKFIFGFHDEKRAQRELKALDRIKHIRHPFLLSLERIDVVDGRMVVITELADMCLSTRFNQSLEEGHFGIERNELIQYMRESADALDYIADSWSLAHLDIKPENILLVGGHAKVADFGLVKDLQAMNQSLMEGLTPAYAAPELFDGRPVRASDQYSLAIVFQELLTGSRPFSGSTAAQLANQHLHSRPDLSELPRSDQPVIARALSKQPEKRYPDCRSFVEELSKRKSRTRKKTPVQRVNPIDTQGVTEAGVDQSALRHDATIQLTDSFSPAVQYEGEVRKLEPFELDESQSTIRPTLIIGVGQTGARTLRQLRTRMSHRLGTREQLPAVRMLCLDVDRSTLCDATAGEESTALHNTETLAIPLRRPEEYRADKKLDVSWIGRRWIYNIPKSQLTEALRPLGRLALVDHHEVIYRRIADELARCSDLENLATTSDTTGLMPSNQSPQVIFVGSVAGGLGSGMLLDLAFTTRVCMSEHGFADDHLFAILTHSTSRVGGDPRLAIANSCSLLNEMYHYNLHGYAGNPACNIPEFDDQTPVFDGTYFVHFGDDINAGQYAAAIDGVAEYLFSSTVTRCTSFFDRCRQTEEFEASMVKTFGINSICQGREDLSGVASQKMMQGLLEQWFNGECPRVDPDRVLEKAHQMLESAGLLNEQMESQLLEWLQATTGADPENWIRARVAEVLKQPEVDTPELIPLVDQCLNDIFGSPDPEQHDEQASHATQPGTLCELLSSRLSQLADQIPETIANAITSLIDDRDFRLAGTRLVADELANQVESFIREIDLMRQQSQQRYDTAESDLRLRLKEARSSRAESVTMECVWQMVSDRLELVLESYKQILANKASRAISSARDQIDQCQLKLKTLQQLLLSNNPSPENTGNGFYNLLTQSTARKAAEQIIDLNDRLETTVLKPEGGLRKVLQETGSRLGRLPARIEREARLQASESSKSVRIDSAVVESKVGAEMFAAWVRELVVPVTPMMFHCGGTARLLVAVPQHAPVATMARLIQEQVSIEANIIPSTCGDIVVCLEMDNMPSENIAMTLLQMQPDCAELLDRLHSRMDVEWSRLTPLC